MRGSSPCMTTQFFMSESDPNQQAAALAQVQGNILLVGAGKMGTAMLEGWLRLGIPAGKLVVIEPNASAQLSALAAQGLALNPEKSADEIAAAVVAVKPQIAPEVMPRIAQLLSERSVAVSIMAGRTLRFLAE